MSHLDDEPENSSRCALQASNSYLSSSKLGTSPPDTQDSVEHLKTWWDVSTDATPFASTAHVCRVPFYFDDKTAVHCQMFRVKNPIAVVVWIALDRHVLPDTTYEGIRVTLHHKITIQSGRRVPYVRMRFLQWCNNRWYPNVLLVRSLLVSVHIQTDPAEISLKSRIRSEPTTSCAHQRGWSTLALRPRAKGAGDPIPPRRILMTMARDKSSKLSSTKLNFWQYDTQETLTPSRGWGAVLVVAVTVPRQTRGRTAATCERGHCHHPIDHWTASKAAREDHQRAMVEAEVRAGYSRRIRWHVRVLLVRIMKGTVAAILELFPPRRAHGRTSRRWWSRSAAWRLTHPLGRGKSGNRMRCVKYDFLWTIGAR